MPYMSEYLSETIIPHSFPTYRRFPKEGHVFYVGQCCVSNKTYFSKAIECRRQQMGFDATCLPLCERMVKTEQQVAKSAPPCKILKEEGGLGQSLWEVCLLGLARAFI